MILLELGAFLLLYLAILYFFISVLFQISLSRPAPHREWMPIVSVLIAARNEEQLLPRCLESLQKQDYPADKLEILVLNDGSSDQTAAIAASFAQQDKRFRLLSIEETVGHLRGKMNAIFQGIQQSRGEIILITDADCQVPAHWVSGFVSLFADRVGMVGGLTLLTPPGRKLSFFERLQALDWVFLQTVAAATAELGFPVTILGNNFGFRREAYEEVGGFQNLDFSVTEDMALMMALHRRTRWKIRYRLQPQTTIFSEPVASLRQFYQQRKRWVLGGRRTSLWGYFILGTGMLLHTFILLGFLIPISVKLAGIALGLESVANFGLAWRTLKRISHKKLLLLFPFFQLFYFVYTFVFAAVALLARKVTWKDRTM